MAAYELEAHLRALTKWFPLPGSMGRACTTRLVKYLVHRSEMTPNPSIERMSSGKLRLPPAAAHVKRLGLLVAVVECIVCLRSRATLPQCVPSSSKASRSAGRGMNQPSILTWSRSNRSTARPTILNALLERAARDGYKEVILETSVGWVSAVAFYERNGFVATVEQDGEQYFRLVLAQT
jgi:hypothetical protein